MDKRKDAVIFWIKKKIRKHKEVASMELTVIQTKIYEIRGHKVMLDFDIAELYEVGTKRLNEQLKRNLDRFPEEFMFRLSVEEWKTMRSQIATAYGKLSQSANGSQKKRNVKAAPYAFTEHGVSMIACILRSERAVRMNIAIVRAFIALRQMALHHKDISQKLAELRDEMYARLGEHDTQLKAIYDAIENLLNDKTEMKNWKERERIGFKK